MKMQDLDSSWIHPTLLSCIGHGGETGQAGCGREARPQAVDTQRDRRKDALGLAAVAHSPGRALANYGRLRLVAGHSPGTGREPTRKGRARACGAACAGRGAASLPRSDEYTSAREGLTP